MAIPEKIIRQFPMIKQLLPLFKPRTIKIIKRDQFNEEHIIMEDDQGNGYTMKNGTLFVIKPMVSE
jgi:hypothetical protein